MGNRRLFSSEEEEGTDGRLGVGENFELRRVWFVTCFAAALGEGEAVVKD